MVRKNFRQYANILAGINWKATLLSAVNLSAKIEVIVRMRVRERTPTCGNGPVIFSETLERGGIGSGLKALENLNLIDDIRESYELTLKKDQVYRIEVELECNLRVDIISLSLVDCNAGTADRGVFVNELKVSYCLFFRQDMYGFFHAVYTCIDCGYYLSVF